MDAIGAVYLDGIRFTTDPNVYEPTMPKRESAHPGLGGTVTTQDFGVFARDATLLLQSGGQYLDSATVNAIDQRYRTLGGTYSFADWVGTEAVVFIRSFKAIPTRIPDLYEYELELRVMSLSRLRGSAYGGL